MRRVTIRSVLSWMVTALFFAPAHGKDMADAAAVEDSKPSSVLQISSTFQSLLSVDANHDGISDEIAEIVQAQTRAPAFSTGNSRRAIELPKRLNEVKTAKTRSVQFSCSEYLLLSPKSRAVANRYIQSRTGGAFGSNPCDPVLSPLIERPLDDRVVQVSLPGLQLKFLAIE